MRYFITLTVLVFSAFANLAAASAEKRVALEIANAGYAHSTALKTPSNDAGIADISVSRAKVCGVALRPRLWQPGQTLTVCFRSGTQKARVRVAQIASEWLQYANLKFDFGDVADPRMCQDGSQDAIKIDFINTGPKSGHWSVLGKLSPKADHSMNLGLLGEDDLPMLERTMRALILHEFGHALGLEHEHHNPKSGCDAEFNEQQLIEYGAQHGWSPKVTKEHLMQYSDDENVFATEVDRKSIMNAPLPSWLFKTGKKSPCYVINYELSEGDKAFIALLYPATIGPNDSPP